MRTLLFGLLKCFAVNFITKECPKAEIEQRNRHKMNTKTITAALLALGNIVYESYYPYYFDKAVVGIYLQPPSTAPPPAQLYTALSWRGPLCAASAATLSWHTYTYFPTQTKAHILQMPIIIKYIRTPENINVQYIRRVLSK